MNAREFFVQAIPTCGAEMHGRPRNAVRPRVLQLLPQHSPAEGAVVDFGCETGADNDGVWAPCRLPVFGRAI